MKKSGAGPEGGLLTRSIPVLPRQTCHKRQSRFLCALHPVHGSVRPVYQVLHALGFPPDITKRPIFILTGPFCNQIYFIFLLAFINNRGIHIISLQMLPSLQSCQLHDKAYLYHLSAQLLNQLDNCLSGSSCGDQSSTMITFWPGRMASLCISMVACPYSRSYSMAMVSQGSFPFLRTGTNPLCCA